MIITIECYDKKFITDINHDDVGCDEALDIVCDLLVSSGFHHESVKNAIINKAESYEVTS